MILTFVVDFFVQIRTVFFVCQSGVDAMDIVTHRGHAASKSLVCGFESYLATFVKTIPVFYLKDQYQEH